MNKVQRGSFPLSGPTVVLVGRQNVGKSTLFNKLVGRRRAIVYNLPGVTRDRNEAVCSYKGRSFTLVDMAGFTSEGDEPLSMTVSLDKTLRAADHIFFVMDAREGLTPVDEELYDRLRHAHRHVFSILNKTEGAGSKNINDFYKLGSESFYPISAEHNLGLSDLLDALYPFLTPSEETFLPRLPQIVVMGRPNAGKSTLINTLLGDERLVTSPIPGTTRDTIDTPVFYKGKRYLFVDTAGIRKRGRVTRGVEQYAVARAKEALVRADIALLLFDGVEGITEQDTKLAGEILEARRGIIPLINKADLLKTEDRERVYNQFDRLFPFLKGQKPTFISGKTGLGQEKIFRAIDGVYERFTTRVSTADINRFMEKTVQVHPPPVVGRRRPKIYYATQATTAPPTFVLFTASDIPPSYLHFIENRLREQFGLIGVPVSIKVRRKERSKD